MFATPQARHRAPARRPGRAAHPHCRSNRIFVARNSLRKPPLRPRLAPPVMLGLIGDARMTGAIWSFARQFLGAAETKVRLGRIADRPTAHRLAQFHNGHGFGYRHHDVPNRLGKHLQMHSLPLSRSPRCGVTKNAHWAALGWRPARRFTQIVFVPALDGLS